MYTSQYLMTVFLACLSRRTPPTPSLTPIPASPSSSPHPFPLLSLPRPIHSFSRHQKYLILSHCYHIDPTSLTGRPQPPTGPIPLVERATVSSCGRTARPQGREPVALLHSTSVVGPALGSLAHRLALLWPKKKFKENILQWWRVIV